MPLTPTAIDRQLDDVAGRIDDQRKVLAKVIQNAGAASASLGEIPTDYAALIADIQALPGSDEWETAVKARLSRYTTEFQALKTVADAIAAASVE